MVYLGTESVPTASSLHNSKHSNNGQQQSERNGSNGDSAHPAGGGSTNATPSSGGTRDGSPSSVSLDRELGPHHGHQIRDRDDSSGDEEREGRIRVGKDYQVMTPEWIPLESKIKLNGKCNALLLE